MTDKKKCSRCGAYTKESAISDMGYCPTCIKVEVDTSYYHFTDGLENAERLIHVVDAALEKAVLMYKDKAPTWDFLTVAHYLELDEYETLDYIRECIWASTAMKQSARDMAEYAAFKVCQLAVAKGFITMNLIKPYSKIFKSDFHLAVGPTGWNILKGNKPKLLDVKPVEEHAIGTVGSKEEKKS